MSSGEISLSVEETNALRIKLGLKPLKTGPSTTESTGAAAAAAAAASLEEKNAAKAKVDEGEVRERIEAAKRKRATREERGIADEAGKSRFFDYNRGL
jgi:U4/U6.U5 tri-snRNP-associated protein 1